VVNNGTNSGTKKIEKRKNQITSNNQSTAIVIINVTTIRSINDIK
jgi:hypothetical protein